MLKKGLLMASRLTTFCAAVWWIAQNRRALLCWISTYLWLVSQTPAAPPGRNLSNRR